MATAGDITRRVWIRTREGSEISLEIDNRRLAFTVTSHKDRWLVHGPGGQIELTELPRFPVLDREGVAGGLIAPMPGNVLVTHVSAGDHVEKGQLLLVLEAMKMEHRITAPISGVVEELKVQEGDQVANGELLIILSDEESS